jgi:putative FmdB family regulatory protein
MPTYDYCCDRCGHRFERFQKMSATPLETCPECGGRVRRLIGTGAAILVKGGSSRSSREACSLESTGRTYCGRDERCGKPPRGGDK